MYWFLNSASFKIIFGSSEIFQAIVNVPKGKKVQIDNTRVTQISYIYNDDYSYKVVYDEDSD